MRLIYSDYSPYETNRFPVGINNLIGSSVVSCERLYNEYGKDGYYFVFADIACRTPGQYRLRFSLHDMDP